MGCPAGFVCLLSCPRKHNSGQHSHPLYLLHMTCCSPLSCNPCHSCSTCILKAHSHIIQCSNSLCCMRQACLMQCSLLLSSEGLCQGLSQRRTLLQTRPH